MRETRTTDDRRDIGLSKGALLEWECPLCGQSGAVLADGDDGERHAIEAVLSHARSTDDEVHGPFASTPEELADESLSRYVA